MTMCERCRIGTRRRRRSPLTWRLVCKACFLIEFDRWQQGQYDR